MKHALIIMICIASLVLHACLPANPTPVQDAPAEPTLPAPTTLPAPAGNDTAPITITFGVDRVNWEFYTPLIKTFHATHPNIRVQLVDIRPLIDNSFAAIAAGQADHTALARGLASAADTFPSEWIAPPEALIFTYNLKPFVDGDPAFAANDFFPLFTELFAQPHVALVPSYADATLLHYNRTLLEAEGVPLPDVNANWDEIMALAERLARRTSTRVTRYGLAESFLASSIQHELAARQIPVTWFQQPLATSQQQQVETFFATMSRRVTDGTLLAPSGSEVSGYESMRMRNQILQQEIAIWDGNILFEIPPEGLPFQIGILPPLDPQAGFAVSGYSISAGTQHPQAAWAWLNFLSRQTAPTAWRNIPASRISARQSVADRTGYWRTMDTSIAEIMRQITTEQRIGIGRDAAEEHAYVQIGQAVTRVAKQQQSTTQALAALREKFATTTIATAPTSVDTAPIIVATPMPEPDVAAGAEQVRFGVTVYRTEAVRQTVQQLNGEAFAVQTVALQPGPLAALAREVDCFSAVAALEDTSPLLDLRPLLDADARRLLDDFPAVVRQPLERDGRLYGLPLTVSLPTINGNAALLEAAGVNLPTSDATPAEMLATAQRLTSGAGATRQHGYAAAGNLSDDLDWWLRRSGVLLVNEAGQPAFTAPATLAAIQSFLTLVRETSPHTRLTGVDEGIPTSEGADAIAAGRVGLWLGLRTTATAAPTNGAVVHGLAPLGTAGLSSADIEVRGGYIAASTTALTGCWSMLTALSATTLGITSANGGPLMLPARPSVAIDPTFTSTLGADGSALANAATVALSRASAQPPPDATLPRQWFYQAVDAALQGDDLVQALTRAEQETAAAMSQR